MRTHDLEIDALVHKRPVVLSLRVTLDRDDVIEAVSVLAVAELDGETWTPGHEEELELIAVLERSGRLDDVERTCAEMAASDDAAERFDSWLADQEV